MKDLRWSISSFLIFPTNITTKKNLKSYFGHNSHSYPNVLLHGVIIRHYSNWTSFTTLQIFKFTYPSHQILMLRSPYCLTVWMKFNLRYPEIGSVPIPPRLNCYWLLKTRAGEGWIPLTGTERGQGFWQVWVWHRLLVWSPTFLKSQQSPRIATLCFYTSDKQHQTQHLNSLCQVLTLICMLNRSMPTLLFNATFFCCQ